MIKVVIEGSTFSYGVGSAVVIMVIVLHPNFIVCVKKNKPDLYLEERL